ARARARAAASGAPRRRGRPARHRRSPPPPRSAPPPGRWGRPRSPPGRMEAGTPWGLQPWPDRSGALLGLDRLGELGQDLVQIAHHPEVAELEDRGVRVLVDR